MSENDIRFEEYECPQVTVNRHDVIVLQYYGVMPEQQRKEIQMHVGKSFPRHQVMVTGGLKPGVVPLQGSCNLCKKMAEVCKECPNYVHT